MISGSDPDDDLDAGYTDQHGYFKLSGDTNEMTTIDPHLKIYHDCNDGVTVRILVLLYFNYCISALILKLLHSSLSRKHFRTILINVK